MCTDHCSRQWSPGEIWKCAWEEGKWNMSGCLRHSGQPKKTLSPLFESIEKHRFNVWWFESYRKPSKQLPGEYTVSRSVICSWNRFDLPSHCWGGAWQSHSSPCFCCVLLSCNHYPIHVKGCALPLSLFQASSERAISSKMLVSDTSLSIATDASSSSQHLLRHFFHISYWPMSCHVIGRRERERERKRSGSIVVKLFYYQHVHIQTTMLEYINLLYSTKRWLAKSLTNL